LAADPHSTSANNANAIVMATQSYQHRLASHTSALDPHKSVKELYHEQLDNNAKYQD
jgi:hypothetical protein